MYNEVFKVEFERRFDRSGDCWEWNRGRDGSGYGKMPFKGKTLRAHRVAYELNNGSIPAGLHILHTCDNPACVRPDHLWAGTNVDNMADKTAKRRAVGAAKGSANGAKLSAEEARKIYSDSRSYRVVSRHYGVSLTAVGDIKTGRTWAKITQAKRGATTLSAVERATYEKQIDDLQRQVGELTNRVAMAALPINESPASGRGGW